MSSRGAILAGAVWMAVFGGCLTVGAAESSNPRQRARDLGIVIGNYASGQFNAITDVPGVKVGHQTLLSGEGVLKPGQGPVRTGVTVIIPRDDVWQK
ncbi:MAG: P1 family peptidase, partial [Nitrospirota bacterium]